MKGSIMQVKKKLLDIVREKIRFKHYSLSNRNLAYLSLMLNFLFKNDKIEIKK